MPKAKSSSATPFCRVCFRDITPNSLRFFFGREMSICPSCYQNLKPTFRHFLVRGVPFLSLYDYEQGFQSLLFQFKGCFDIELAPVFLDMALPLLKVRYRGYALVPAPSSEEHNQRRGFNHVIEAFSSLGLPILPLLEKRSDRKQTDCSLAERKKVGEILGLKAKTSLRNKKVLFVDDVFTTGSTAKACLALLQKLHPKKLEGLVLAKVIPK